DGALGQLLADLDVGAVVHAQPDPLGDLVVDDLVAPVVRHDDDLASPVPVLDPDASGELGDRRLALWHPGLEDLLDPWQTLGDVLTGDTAGVERPHGQLGARLADRLGSDDPDRLANVHQLAGGQRPAVAGGADAELGLAGQHAADRDRLDPRRDELVHQQRGDVLPRLRDHVAVGVGDVAREVPGVDAGLGVPVRTQRAFLGPLRHRHGDGAVRAAVVLADDHVLGDVDEPSRQVPRVRGPQRRVRQTLARAVGGDEVLQHRQALPVGGLDRPRDDLTLGVGDQPPDRGDLPQLEQAAAG